MPIAATKTINLYYEIHGESNPETLLLINGVGQWHAAWWRNVEALAQSFRVVTFDNRGIGDSDKPDVAYTLEMMADDTLALMDALNIEKTHVLGHSMGGGIALFMAKKASERMGKMILASTLYWGPKVVMPSARAMQVLMDRSGDPVELVKRGIRIAAADGFEERDPEGFARLIELRFQSKQPPEFYLKQSQSGLTYLQHDHIADFTPPTPVLLMVGECDEVAPRANSDAIAAVWGCPVLEIQGAGHLFNIEKPAETNAAILEFLKA